MEGEVYHKVIHKPSVGTIVAIAVVSVLLIYVVLCVAMVVPEPYNLVKYLQPSAPTTGGNETAGNNTTAIMKYPEIKVWGMPAQVNITENPSTVWKISFKVIRGTIDGFKIAFSTEGLTNVSVTLSSSYSNWVINGTTAEYIGKLSAGAIVSIDLHIDAQTNATSNNGYIEFVPMTTGIIFTIDTVTTEIVQ